MAASSDTATDAALDIPEDEGFEIVLEAHASAPVDEDRHLAYTGSDQALAQATTATAVGDLDATSSPLPYKLRQLVGKLKIQLAARNPLPPLCRAIQESHFPPKNDAFERKLSTGFWANSLLNAAVMVNDADGAPYDVSSVPSAMPIEAEFCGRDDMMVAKLPTPVQHAFRQSVLRTILLPKCGIAAGVCTCIAVLPFDVWRQQQSETQSWLPHVLFSASVMLYVLTLGLLYGVRHDFPINSAVLVFLLGVEVCCALLWCLLGNLNAIVSGSVQYMAMMMVVVSISSAVYCSSMLPIMSKSSIPPWTFAGELVCVTFAGLWTGLTLYCMSASLTPDKYTRCLIFYHSDVFVACCVAPYRWSLKRWRAAAKVLRRRSVATAPAQSELAESSSDPDDDVMAPVDNGVSRSDEDYIGDLESQQQGLSSPTRRRSSIVAVV